MNNPRVTAKERGLIKGAIRRVFSRSELRLAVISEAIIDHKDPNRPRVTKWCKCAVCRTPTPKYLTQVDHLVPLVPLESSLEEMSWDEVVARTWCDKSNLQAICLTCHKIKSVLESKERRKFKKERKRG